MGPSVIMGPSSAESGEATGAPRVPPEKSLCRCEPGRPHAGGGLKAVACVCCVP